MHYVIVSSTRIKPVTWNLSKKQNNQKPFFRSLGKIVTQSQQVQLNAIIGFLDAGIDPARIIIDPGIGFGKTFDQNLTLINRLLLKVITP